MNSMNAVEIRVRGTVQGVGFRPTVWRLAKDTQLVGEVFNDAHGVLIRISGQHNNVSNFLKRLPDAAPPLARIATIEVQSLSTTPTFTDFQITPSRTGSGHTQITADAATCDACRDEILNPQAHRFLYPFTNCTHCGPRLSIVHRIPYDRANTTMADFPLCPICEQEYRDPADRRFHAQPIACHHCGPKLWLEYPEHTNTQSTTTRAGSANAVARMLVVIADSLKQGKIVAIKGIGGFHLACDASNPEAVQRLRQRKQRYAKPFALMARDLEIIERYCPVSALEKAHLNASAAPIVLLQTHQERLLPDAIAPGSHLLGFMLPYTPLHILITQQLTFPLVLTSGNLSHQPQIIENAAARDQLRGIADLLVMHDRTIANRIDDSILRVIDNKPRLLRRARGYAPSTIALPAGFENAPELVAYGAELKSTFCLLQAGAAIVSQHQGDLEDVQTFDDYARNLSLYQALYRHHPTGLVADRHPEYLSGKLARAEASKAGLPLFEVQHHHAHIASCLTENGVPLDSPAVLGIALDGLGFGGDNTLWGGEFLIADYCNYQRVGMFKPIPMIGGAQAIREPWRNTYAHIIDALGWATFQAHYGATPLGQFLRTKPLNVIDKMLASHINTPPASSCGRLFDAVAAALGLCRERAHFEGQGAIELEMLVDESTLQDTRLTPYTFDIIDAGATQPCVLTARKMWLALLHDLAEQVAPTVMATRFHAGLAQAIIQLVLHIKTHRPNVPFTTVALSGGCFQNKVLLQAVTNGIEQHGLLCLSHAELPANDGGLCLGQATVAAARLLRGNPTEQLSRA